MAEELRNIVNPQVVQSVAKALKSLSGKVDEGGFVKKVLIDWNEKSLTERISAIRIGLHDQLSGDYSKDRHTIVELAGLLDTGYTYIFIPEYIQFYGLDFEEEAMEDISRVTQFSSGEFAVRPFIERNPSSAMKTMHKWSSHKNEHVRRLSSEGCRPRLPWGKALNDFKKDPSPIWPILENLMDDESLYVRKSVANNINDISKDHPDLVLDFASRWVDHSVHARWIIKRGLRTLLKQGNPKSLQLFGYGTPEELEVGIFELSKQSVRIGEKVNLTFNLRSRSERELKVRLEYKIGFVKKNGSLSYKVFQIAETSFAPGERRDYSKSHDFKQRSTRIHYPGQHHIELIVNGIGMSNLTLDLKP